MTITRRVLIVCLLGVAAQARAQEPRAAGRLPEPARPRRVEPPPDHVAYAILFRQAVLFDERAQEQERAGKDGAALRRFHRDRLGLDEAREAALLDVAHALHQDLAALDAEAGEIIREARGHYPQGRVPAGQAVPPPPAQLGKLQSRRDGRVLQARDDLRARLGTDGFAALDRAFRERIVPKIQKLEPGARPAASVAR